MTEEKQLHKEKTLSDKAYDLAVWELNLLYDGIPNLYELSSGSTNTAIVNTFFDQIIKSLFGSNPIAATIVRDIMKYPAVYFNAAYNVSQGMSKLLTFDDSHTSMQLGKIVCKTSFLGPAYMYKLITIKVNGEIVRDIDISSEARIAAYACETGNKILESYSIERQLSNNTSIEFNNYVTDNYDFPHVNKGFAGSFPKVWANDMLGEYVFNRGAIKGHALFSEYSKDEIFAKGSDWAAKRIKKSGEKLSANFVTKFSEKSEELNFDSIKAKGLSEIISGSLYYYTQKLIELVTPDNLLGGVDLAASLWGNLKIIHSNTELNFGKKFAAGGLTMGGKFAVCFMFELSKSLILIPVSRFITKNGYALVDFISSYYEENIEKLESKEVQKEVSLFEELVTNITKPIIVDAYLGSGEYIKALGTDIYSGATNLYQNYINLEQVNEYQNDEL